MTPSAPPRLPRRFRRRLLAVLLLAGSMPVLLAGLGARALVEGALSVSPPLEPLLARTAEALERRGEAALVGDLRAAELHLAQAELARRQILARTPLYFGAALAGSVLLVAAAAWLLGRRLSRPVETLAAGMARIARGDLDHRLPEPGRRGDELDFLGRQLNWMAGELAAGRRKLQASETLAAWRDVARVMAHDLKNPLTAMRMALGRLGRPGRTEAALDESVSLLQDEVDVLIRMTRSFSEFALLPAPLRKPLDLVALARDVCALYAEDRAVTMVRFRAEEAAPIVVEGDADQLRRTIGNLVKNAVEASRPDSAPIEVTVGIEAGAARLSVADDGVGIAAPRQDAALMKGLGSSKGEARGLGLPVAHAIAHAHGGTLRLVPRAPRGAEAVLEVPLAAEAA